jgi:hypothetical protein
MAPPEEEAAAALARARAARAAARVDSDARLDAQVAFDGGAEAEFYAACVAGDLAEAEEIFFEEGAPPLDPPAVLLAFGQACQRGQLRIARWLAGVRPELPWELSQAVLVEVAARGHLPVLRWLAEQERSDCASCGCRCAGSFRVDLATGGGLPARAAAAAGHGAVAAWLAAWAASPDGAPPPLPPPARPPAKASASAEASASASASASAFPPIGAGGVAAPPSPPRVAPPLPPPPPPPPPDRARSPPGPPLPWAPHPRALPGPGLRARVAALARGGAPPPH